jgi:hypothetical protein
VIAILPGVWRGWPAMRGIAYVERPGVIFVLPDSTRLRVLADGSAEEIGEVPRRWSRSADPCATRRGGAMSAVRVGRPRRGDGGER